MCCALPPSHTTWMASCPYSQSRWTCFVRALLEQKRTRSGGRLPSTEVALLRSRDPLRSCVDEQARNLEMPFATGHQYTPPGIFVEPVHVDAHGVTCAPNRSCRNYCRMERLLLRVIRAALDHGLVLRVAALAHHIDRLPAHLLQSRWSDVLFAPFSSRSARGQVAVLCCPVQRSRCYRSRDRLRSCVDEQARNPR